MHFEPWQWLLAAVAAFGIGLSKTGLPGVGILAVALFALGTDALASVGLVLPLLIAGDVVAVKTYRHHAEWHHLKRLIPWAVAGILLGWGAMDLLKGNRYFEQAVGTILIGLVLLQLWRKRHPKPEDAPQGVFWTPVMGLLAGFLTMLANAAGPVMNLYLLGMRLPKLAFMGTGAWYFLLLNCFKVPLNVQQGIINRESIIIDLCLVPAVWTGAVAGKKLLPHINQEAFEAFSLVLTVVAAFKLLFLHS